LTLLARRYPTDDAVIVKAAPDLCNWMGNLLLDHDADTRIIFLHAPLRVFLLQILRREGRRHMARKNLQSLSQPMAQVPFLSAIAVSDLTDGQCAAAMWLLHSFLCGSLLTRPDSHRVLALNGEGVISDPKQTVWAAADFLGLAGGKANHAALEMVRPSSQHAKFGQVHAYDAITRAADLADAEVRYEGEVQAALSWASTMSSGWLAESPFPVV
jgi:hypothetical protein